MLGETSIIIISRNGEDMPNIQSDTSDKDSREDKIGELENETLLSNINNNAEESLINLDTLGLNEDIALIIDN